MASLHNITTIQLYYSIYVCAPQHTYSECNATCASWKALDQLNVLVVKLFDFVASYGIVEHASALDGKCPHFIFVNAHSHGFCYNNVIMRSIIRI